MSTAFKAAPRRSWSPGRKRSGLAQDACSELRFLPEMKRSSPLGAKTRELRIRPTCREISLSPFLSRSSTSYFLVEVSGIGYLAAAPLPTKFTKWQLFRGIVNHLVSPMACRSRHASTPGAHLKTSMAASGVTSCHTQLVRRMQWDFIGFHEISEEFQDFCKHFSKSS